MASLQASLYKADLQRIRKEADDAKLDKQIAYLQLQVFKSQIDKGFLQKIGSTLIETEVEFKRHQIVFGMGEVNDSVYFVKEGTVKMLIPVDSNHAADKNNKKWHCLAILSQGEFLGEDCLAKSKENKYSAVVESLVCTLYKIKTDFLRKQISYSYPLEYFFKSIIQNRTERRATFYRDGQTYNQYHNKIKKDELRRKELSVDLPTDPVEIIKTKKMRAVTPMRTNFLFKRMIGDKVYKFLSPSNEDLNLKTFLADCSSDYKHLFNKKLTRRLLVSKIPNDEIGKIMIAESKSRIDHYQAIDDAIYSTDSKNTSKIEFEVVAKRPASFSINRKFSTQRDFSLDMMSLDGRLAMTEGDMRITWSSFSTSRPPTRNSMLSSKHNLFRKKPEKAELKERYNLNPRSGRNIPNKLLLK